MGITGHTHTAPSVHTEALRRFDFDSVLTPMNYQLAKDPKYAAAFSGLLEAVGARDTALMTTLSDDDLAAIDRVAPVGIAAGAQEHLPPQVGVSGRHPGRMKKDGSDLLRATGAARYKVLTPRKRERDRWKSRFLSNQVRA